MHMSILSMKRACTWKTWDRKSDSERMCHAEDGGAR